MAQISVEAFFCIVKVVNDHIKFPLKYNLCIENCSSIKERQKSALHLKISSEVFDLFPISVLLFRDIFYNYTLLDLRWFFAVSRKSENIEQRKCDRHPIEYLFTGVTVQWTFCQFKKVICFLKQQKNLENTYAVWLKWRHVQEYKLFSFVSFFACGWETKLDLTNSTIH